MPGPNPERPLALTAVVVVVCALLGVGIWLLVRAADSDGGSALPSWVVTTSGTPGDPNGEESGSGYGDGGSYGDPERTPEPEPETPEATEPAPEEPVAPAGYRTVDDEAGFRIAVPEGWYRTTRDTSVYYAPRDPALTRTSFLQIFELEGPEPTPYDSAVEAERLVAHLPGYTRLTLARGSGSPGAADLQYTYTHDEFGPRHVADHRFATADGTMYAIVAVGPVEESGVQIEALGNAVRFFCESGDGC